MPKPRRYMAEGTTRFASGDMRTRMQRACPRCGAGPYYSCFKLPSWVGPPPLIGFYTARQKSMHPERRAPVSPPEPGGRTELRGGAELRTRSALRTQIGSLVMKKCPGNERAATNRWARSSARTVPELQARVDELQKLPDLPW